MIIPVIPLPKCTNKDDHCRRIFVFILGIVGWLFDMIIPVIPLPPPLPPLPAPQPAAPVVEGDCRVSCINWPYQQCEVKFESPASRSRDRFRGAAPIPGKIFRLIADARIDFR